MWDLPGPGIEPMSPALAGRFLTTAPPGKSYKILLFNLFYNHKNDWATFSSTFPQILRYVEQEKNMSLEELENIQWSI